MRKFLIVIGIMVIILAALTEIVLPQTISSLLKSRLEALSHSQQVNLSVDSSPRFLIATGHIDELHGDVINGSIGEIQASNLSLDAQNINVDMAALLFGQSDSLDKHKAFDDYLSSIGKVELVAIINEDNLKSFLELKVSKLENLNVKITAEEIVATANVQIMGRTADVELSGLIIADDGDLYFRMTRLNVRNAILRHVQLDRFFGDIKIADAGKLPIGLKFDNVELQAGQAILTAVRN